MVSGKGKKEKEEEEEMIKYVELTERETPREIIDSRRKGIFPTRGSFLFFHVFIYSYLYKSKMHTKKNNRKGSLCRAK